MHPELERARARYQAQETPEELSLAVRAAIRDYYDKHGIAYNPDELCAGDCECCHLHDEASAEQGA